MSPPPTAPRSHRIAVHPVIASKSEMCPTRIPEMSVSPFTLSPKTRRSPCLLMPYGSIEFRGPTYLLDLLKEPVLSVQEFFLLSGRAFRNFTRSPHYWDDVFLQMDLIEIGRAH